MSLFQGRSLTCNRGGRTVFANLDFAVSAGETLVLRGPNGSGKSSLLRLMAGLSRPEAGEISWDGEALSEDPEAHGARLHYVGHLDAVKPALTVAENLSVWAGLRTADQSGVKRALARFGLDRLAEIPARLLSAGQRRRLALARIEATPAPLWLLDEPTVALDVTAVAALEGAIAEHCGGGGIAVVSSHVDLGLERTGALELGDFAVDPDAAWGLAL
jgi:heme exporter protein A